MPEPINPPLERREFAFRAESIDLDEGIIRGIAVPFDTPVRIREWFDEYDEQFAPGSVDDDGALAFWRHTDPIGYMRSGTDVDAGREVELQISQTTLGRDALTLARDLEAGGRSMQLSVGFEPGGDHTVEERDNDVPLVTRTRVRVREISLVPFGAYGDAATVTEVRERPNRPTNERTTMPPVQEREPEVDPVGRDEFDEAVRSLTQSIENRPDEPARDLRSAAQFLRDLAAGDPATVEQYNRAQEHLYDEIQHRAYTGGTTADAPVRDAWVGDLTRIFDGASGVLAETFSTGTLPDTGMNLEYAQLKSNSVTVAEQTAEGDDLPFGKVELEIKTTPVKTYGGVASLSRQKIERSTLPVLNRTLEALAVAAGATKKAALRAAYNALVTARRGVSSDGGVVVLGSTLAASTADNWEDALIDAAIRFEAENAPLERLLVSTSVFKKMRSLTVSGERVFEVANDNHSGTLNLPGLEGNLAGLNVRLDAGQSGNSAVFVNGRALRAYDSALVSLQDENIVNLTKDFGVYRYGAVAPEVPQFLVPVKIATS